MTRAIRVRILSDDLSEPSAPPPEAIAMESDFVTIFAALLCALICMVGLIAFFRCAWLHRGLENGSGSGSAMANQSSANKGLKKKTLQSLPKFIFRESNNSEGESKMKFSEECGICLGEFAEGDEIRKLPQCGHCFHMGCVDTWLGSHSSCPFCRKVLVVTTRCNKCGHHPAAAAAAQGGEAELKAMEDQNANANANNSARAFLP